MEVHFEISYPCLLAFSLKFKAAQFSTVRYRQDSCLMLVKPLSHPVQDGVCSAALPRKVPGSVHISISPHFESLRTNIWNHIAAAVSQSRVTSSFSFREAQRRLQWPRKTTHRKEKLQGALSEER